MEHAEAVKLIKDYGFAVLKHQNNWLGEAYEALLRALLSASIADTAGAKPAARVSYRVEADGDTYSFFEWLGDVPPQGTLLYTAKVPSLDDAQIQRLWALANTKRVPEFIEATQSLLAAPPAPSVADAECGLTEERKQAIAASVEQRYGETIHNAVDSVADAAGASRSLGKWTITKPKMDGSGGYTTYETHDAKEARDAGMQGWGVAQHIELASEVPVEVWNGERKVTIYSDIVLRSWGTNIATEMSEAPRTLQSVQDAMVWLFAAGASEGQAPVAWTLQCELDEKRSICDAHLWFSNPRNSSWTALYTHPSAELTALRERVAGMEKDAEMLDWLSERGAWIAWSKDREVCRVFHRNDEGDPEPIMGWGCGCHHTAREAISTCMKDDHK